MNAARSFLRQKTPHGHHRVTYVELFFDLEFVFANTLISHTLLAQFTPLGLLLVLIMFFAVWWVWIYTSWITNWLDPERLLFWLLLFVLLFGCGLLGVGVVKVRPKRLPIP